MAYTYPPCHRFDRVKITCKVHPEPNVIGEWGVVLEILEKDRRYLVTLDKDVESVDGQILKDCLLWRDEFEVKPRKRVQTR